MAHMGLAADKSSDRGWLAQNKKVSFFNSSNYYWTTIKNNYDVYSLARSSASVPNPDFFPHSTQCMILN